MNTKFEVLGEGSVEFVKVLLVLGNLAYEVKSLLDKVLADDLSKVSFHPSDWSHKAHLQNLVLLESLTRDVEWQVLGVDNTDHKVEVLRHHFTP